MFFTWLNVIAHLHVIGWSVLVVSHRQPSSLCLFFVIKSCSRDEACVESATVSVLCYDIMYCINLKCFYQLLAISLRLIIVRCTFLLPEIFFYVEAIIHIFLSVEAQFWQYSCLAMSLHRGAATDSHQLFYSTGSLFYFGLFCMA